MEYVLIMKLIVSMLDLSVLGCMTKVNHTGFTWFGVLIAFIDVLLIVKFQMAFLALVLAMLFVVYYKRTQRNQL